MGVPMRATTCVPDFVRQWDAKIAKIAASFGMAEQVDDIKQEIYLSICTKDKDGKNGLERYNPACSHFSTYVYALILVKVKNYRSRTLRQRAYELPEPGSNSQDDDRPRKSDKEPGDSIAAMRGEWVIQIDDIKKELESYPVRSWFFRDGECVNRDLSDLWDLILEGKSRQEIKEHFQYSTGSVGELFDRLRQVPAVRALLGEDDSI